MTANGGRYVRELAIRSAALHLALQATHYHRSCYAYGLEKDCKVTLLPATKRI